MKFADALEIIGGEEKPDGYIVSFESKTGPTLGMDLFPDIWSNEFPIPDEEHAWRLAEDFAAKTKGKFINIHVCTVKKLAGGLFKIKETDQYESRRIENR